MKKLIESVKVASETDLNVEWLEPFMHETRFQPGDVIFSKGDVADEAFLLVEGAVDLVEINASLAPGALFGEMALFTHHGLRAATARCREACVILKISYDEFEQLYYQNPQFGLYLVRLIVRRFERNLDHARQEAAPVPAALPQGA
jgi:CRP-like cAMP-binding protein